MSGFRRSSTKRAALLASTALCMAPFLTALPAAAQDATWLNAPGSGDFNTAANWSPGTVPTGTAFFDTSATTNLSIGTATVGGWTFNAGASSYSFTNSGIFEFSGAGIAVNGGSATITNNNVLTFYNASTAGSAGITNDSVLEFRDNSSAGGAGITNNYFGQFFDSSSAGSSAITNNGILVFSGSSSADSATITNPIGAILRFFQTSKAGTATITNGNLLEFRGASSADGATITNNNLLEFFDNSSAGSAAITNGNTIRFRDSSSAGGATITNNSTLEFLNTSTAGSAGITNSSNLQFFNTASAGNATIANNDFVGFNDASTAGSAAITNFAGLWFRDASSAGSAAITNNASLLFFNNASAGSATLTNANVALVQFLANSTAGSATIANGGNLQFQLSSTAGSAAITNNGFADFLGSSTALTATIINFSTVRFFENASAGSATITNTGAGSLEFYNTSSASSANIANNAFLLFSGASSAGTATIVNNSVLQFLNTSTAGNAAITNGALGNTDFSFSTGPASDNKLSAGSLAGGGTFNLGANELTVGGNNLSTSVTGVIADGGGGGGTGAKLIKTGTGTMTLLGANIYTGATTVDAGTLRVDGSIAASSGVTVNNGGTLAGGGAVGNTIVNSGGTLLAGNGTAGSSLTVSGTLGLDAASTYAVNVNPATSSFANVSGAATLGGATVNAIFAPGSYVSKKYTILTAGSINGTFGTLTNTNLPANFHDSLSYDATHAYLNLDLIFTTPAAGTINGNQNAVANALIHSFNSNGGIPLTFATLSALALSQASGETATGSQQGTFNTMTQFVGLMTDPFTAGRSDGANAPAWSGDDVAANAYASSGKPRSKGEREAYAALYSKAPVAAPFVARWNVWGAGFGGAQTTDGSTAAGSNTSTSRLFGMAAGADYFFSPNTVAGFALAGGGSSFSVANAGSGRSDVFQAGAFIRHTAGAAYITGALAYGWQDVTTDRTVTIAGIDRLRAQFNINAFSGRGEAGYRFVSTWIGGIGITPYAAGQFTTFELPSYTEQVVSGADTFALAYGSKSVTATRSELGFRVDKSFAMQSAILTLRGRAAWAHDFNPDRAVGATFQTLPGASFVVNGARQASDSALTTASAEINWMNGWSAASTFEGEFSNVTRSYAGKGVARYTW
ncbi:MAG: autotransporter domain-containing protein [Pseudomonadota bacterium]